MKLDPLTRSRVDRMTAELVVEFEGVFAQGSVARVVEDTMQRMGEITVTRFVPLLVQRFARDRLLAAAQADGLISRFMPNVVFICSANAGRSQMAAAIANHVSQGGVRAWSAGADPAGHIDLAVIESMKPIGCTSVVGAG